MKKEKKKPLLLKYPLRTWITLGVLSLIICISCMGGCSYLNKKLSLKDDNLAEQSLEKIIELQTGVSIDLTPVFDG